MSDRGTRERCGLTYIHHFHWIMTLLQSVQNFICVFCKKNNKIKNKNIKNKRIVFILIFCPCLIVWIFFFFCFLLFVGCCSLFFVCFVCCFFVVVVVSFWFFNFVFLRLKYRFAKSFIVSVALSCLVLYRKFVYCIVLSCLIE